MTHAKAAALVCALAALGAAIVASIYWYKSSRVPITTAAAHPSSIGDAPAVHILGAHVDIGSLRNALEQSAKLNGYAAIWTGAAALLSAFASILGVV
jgi:hypothetical protein